VQLDELQPAGLPEPSPAEQARAARFNDPEAAERYLRSHRALRAILASITSVPLDFAFAERGKPYLPGAPEVKFNLSHSHGMALVGVGLEVEIGVDVERFRAVPESVAIAERFFPPSEAAEFSATPVEERQREFFRRWTRIEAKLKASGEGLYGAGAERGGVWSIHEIDAGEGYAAAVAVAAEGVLALVHDFEPGAVRPESEPRT
jgi:4'-phosphopantetheinyl transferase